MSPKELDYCEDCLSVEMQLQLKCVDYSEKIEDKKLKSFVKLLSEKHKSHFDNIFSVMRKN